MTTRRTPGLTADEQWKIDRGPDPVMVGGVPMAPLSAGERLEALHPVKVPETPIEVRHVFAGTADELEELEPCVDGRHRWYRAAADESTWLAPILAADHHPELVPADGRVIVTTLTGNSRSVRYRVALADDRAAHEAEHERQAYAQRHPLEGPRHYLPDVPLTLAAERLVDVADVLARFERRRQRLVRIGAGVTFAMPDTAASATYGDQMFWPIGDPDRDLLERWAPLLAARLGGPKVPCAMDGCNRPADVMLAGRVAICRIHFDAGLDRPAPVAKPGRLAAAAGALAGAVLGG
jgi:hypothetical protein